MNSNIDVLIISELLDGTIEFKDEVLNVKLIVKDTIAPVINGYKDIETKYIS